MSMPQYPWDLEERAEDAFVALIKGAIGRNAMVIASKTVCKVEYPLVVVSHGQSDNASDDATFNGKRRFDIAVHIITEAVNNSTELDQEAVLETARETHRAFKASVLGALASTALHGELNELQSQGILFSMAHMTLQTSDAGDGKLVTEQQVDVIAQPREI